MNKLDYCYHNHTERCGHARGTDEQFVLKAIKNNIKVLGFSDHIFLKNIDLPGNRGSYNQLDDYIDSINSLKKKYQDEIEIHLGFEAEYYPEYVSYYKELLESKKIEYLILGQHCFLKDGKLAFYGLQKNKRKATLKYTKDIIKGMKTGLFKYVCHPDFFIYWIGKDTSLFKRCSKRIIKAAIKYDLALEINLGGIRNPNLPKEGKYACEDFFELVGKLGGKVIVGIDAHDPQDYVISDIEYAYYLINKYSLNEVRRLDFKNNC